MHLAAVRRVVGELLLLVEVQHLHLGLVVSLGVVVRVDLLHEGAPIIIVEPLDQPGVALVTVDRALIDLGEGGRSVDLREDLARLGVHDGDVVHVGRSQRHPLGRVGALGVVEAASLMHEHAQVMREELEHVPGLASLAEGLVLVERQLERSAADVVGQDDRVVRVDRHRVARRVEQIPRVLHQVLVHRAAARHDDHGALLAATADAAGALHRA